ncbi:histone acetyltransferase of the MYST family 1 [Actinidia rufa]|uniref:Histone acetyltransferase of the MYST family 1 n=1 Tax=Actinidia rufa TaxID=165716 RepID=A0A7J0EJF8_9ERIC|nr:histone acetyltransferase of the MYST family 1 [Actinidia rufa]
MGSIDAPTSKEKASTLSSGVAQNQPAGDVPSPPPADSGTENDTSRKRKSSALPLEVGTRVMCRWRDGKFHQVKVIERRRTQNGDDYEYYVHYTECENLSQ